jgi:hypothetical protein
MNGHRIRPHSSKKGLNASSPRPACPWCGRPAGAAPRGIVVGHPTGRVEERGRRVLVVDPEEERGLWTLKTHPNIDRQLPFWFDLLHSKPIPTQAPPDYRLVSKRM